MTASRTLALAAAMICALFAVSPYDATAAQDKLNIDELRVRAANGDQTAARKLAQAYYLGHDGVAQNFSEAAHWYLMLAKQGDAPAQTSIGLMYARGYGVKMDPEAARKWWTLAAVQNEPGAQFNLGLIYSNGNGVAQDYAQAFRWFHEAAMRGHVQAQHNLGMLYHEGKGTRRDPVNAYYWIAIAARQGDDMARKSLQTMTAGITRAQVDATNKRVDEWFNHPAKSRQ